MYRRRHILQQFQERRKLESNVALTKAFDETGQPVTALLFSDGMTAAKGKLL